MKDKYKEISNLDKRLYIIEQWCFYHPHVQNQKHFLYIKIVHLTLHITNKKSKNFKRERKWLAFHKETL